MHRNVIDLKQFSKAFASQQNKQKPCPPIVLVAIFGYTHRADVTDIASIYSNVFWRQELSMGCQVGKKHLLFAYMAIIFSLIDVIFYHIGTI